ncbi:MAG TPA: hypothetical protein PK513_06395 [Alphaproteobacteria bacterium]|nr:hypothetical protein [Alphaproteobacteria bacterium]USO04710.1 MAG: hypothetical protein H6859_05950 [Rhodospirillales bacterium]HOO82113.1 hypothetical protein [Alphaproteobacteria bacterium]
MSEAIFGFLGVIIGSFIPWVREWLNEKRLREKHAAYLAVQIICVLDEYVGKCCEVVGDDGTIMGQPDYEEFFEARQDGYANLGLDAIELKEALRKKYEIPDENFEINPDWNARKFLEKKRDGIEERRKQRASHFHEMTKEIRAT